MSETLVAAFHVPSRKDAIAAASAWLDAEPKVAEYEVRKAVRRAFGFSGEVFAVSLKVTWTDEADAQEPLPFEAVS